MSIKNILNKSYKYIKWRKNNMKIGIISDVHGNISALDAVLKDLDKENINKIICLGDFIGRSGKIRRSNTKDIANKRKMYMCKRK